MTHSLILCRNVKIPVEFRPAEYHDDRGVEYVKRLYGKQLKGKLGDAEFFVYKKSVDARKVQNIVFIYTIGIVPSDDVTDERIKKCLTRDFELVCANEPDFGRISDARTANIKPVVIGFGQSGVNGYGRT